VRKSAAYWEERKRFTYYQEVLRLARKHAPGAAAALDVGGADCEYMGWFDWIREKWVVDSRPGWVPEGVRQVCIDFMSYLCEDFDLVLCLQVLEHLPKPEPFARKLLTTGKTVIVSVPYKWARGQEPQHVQDPVDESMLRSWFGRDWDDFAIVKDEAERMIAVFK